MKVKELIPKFIVAIVCFIIGVSIGLITYHYFFKNVYEISNVNYKVGSCEKGIKSNRLFLISYDEQNKILNAEVWVNCCGVEIKVKKEDSTYKILEKQVGELCRCMCRRRVTIFNVSEKAKVEFVDKDGNSFILSPNIKFCGWSTYGKCNNDEDCIRSGCSKQVCQSKFEESIVTTCEWIDCYDANKYGVACKCVNGRCQWVY